MSRNKTIKEALFAAKKELKESGAGEYKLDAELFIMKAANMTKTSVLINGDKELTESEEKLFNSMVQKRKKGVPAQYILGKCEFMGYEFFVDENVLIPRPDTEVLVETVLKTAENANFQNVIDMCTGSGCIAISLALNGIKNVTACDISIGALSTAKKNAEYNNALDKIQFIQGDLFENVDKSQKYNAVISNPPYIPTEDISNLMREVRDNEPLTALDGGKDGLDFYRRITNDSLEYLDDGGYLFFEIGYNQGKDLKKIMTDLGFDGIKIVKDYAGLDRVVFGYKRRGTDVI